MDQELRELEQQFKINPTDKELEEKLLASRKRAGIRPTDVAGAMLEFNHLREKAAEAKKQLIKDGKEIFNLYLKAVFAENPPLKVVVVQGWTFCSDQKPGAAKN